MLTPILNEICYRKEVDMFRTFRALFRKVFRIREAVESVNTTIKEAGTITQQKDLKDVANAIAQTVHDAGAATGSIQDATK